MLEIKDLSVSLEGRNGPVEILRNINLTLEDHLLYVFTGPNGGGKSTLAKAIMGIYPAAAGKILLNGQDITSLSITERACLGVGYAFQQPPRFKGLTVGKMLEIACGKNRTCEDCNYLYSVGLCPQDYIGREVDTSLSGGEVKRIEIATLLARDLKVAIYDEPEAGIDLWSFSRLIETFNNLHEQYDTTIILISHQERIINLADEIILVADGGIKEKGRKEEVWPLIMQDATCTCRGDCNERVG
ncbi:MAG: ATP-binding cassette domain-containing protein [Desulfotomaculaceae bacterium]|nr:ATP-binding cassette domain-containing protein [Desulfotomaculaceae bacterium]MDD4766126.1 ATP-binding cassette domain-containing protein [Desulfotomaculaceae bacterium]